MDRLNKIFALLVVLFAVFNASAQQGNTSAVPNLVQFSGKLFQNDVPLPESRTIGVTFAIYKQQDGGAPVWLETQNVTVDGSGHYSVLLGSTRAEGLPADLFTTQEDRWLGAQVQGHAEQPRVLLVSVPYAMKAAEADRLAGRSVSEFVTTENLQSAVREQLQLQAPKGVASNPVVATGEAVNTGLNGPVTNPATNFVDSTSDQVVQVQQIGTGVGLAASSPSKVGVVGTTNASAISGVVAGVEGVSSLNASYGMYGRATSTSASQPGIGVLGQSDSPNGIGLSGWAAGTGNTIGLQGGASSTAGFAINATETATSGNTVGLVARVLSPIGIPVLIFNNSTSPVTGSLISARTLNGVQFSVGGTGNVSAAGTIAGTRVISTVATGTAPLQVASTTLVPNLNASFLGGIPASAFAPALGSNGYIQNGTAQQIGASFNIDGSGTAGGTMTGKAVASVTNYQIAGTGVVFSVGTAGDQNIFLGSGAGASNTPGFGQHNAFSGYNAGVQNTTGSNNTFSGSAAGQFNTTGNNNTFLGANAGQPVLTGGGNTFLGFNAGASAGPGASNNLYLSNQGVGTDNGVIRIGDPASQTAAYMAGISGASTSFGTPIFVDSSGKLGTTGGAIDFTQLSGTLTNPQLSGTYTNAIVLSNFSNAFVGSGVGLINVNAALLGGLSATDFAPASGSTNYIRSGTSVQSGSNFNIDGSGTVGGTLTANGVASATNYQIAGSGVVFSVGTAADQNLFLGGGAGSNNLAGSGQHNAFSGYNAGVQNTTGSNNTFSGASAGQLNTTGSNNTIIGSNAGQAAITGSGNTFLGFNAGASVGPASNNNLFISNLGVATDSGVIRIGDPASQTAAYIAGISGASTTSGVPVFIDSGGKLGTGGGSVSFSQVTGTVTSSQLTGTYTNPITLSSSGNAITGSFTGNGSGLTGVASGLNWPVVTMAADYTVQLSDFATPTTHGNYVVLTGAVSHTFTLPNPPPPNGYCVAIGNVADAGINSGTNVFLSVNPNGMLVDNSVTSPTMPRRTAYLYCSDGSAGYYRLGYQQNGVSEIGPWIKTLDTGTVNAMTTTFRNGMDFGLTDGSVIFLLPKFTNTSNIVTLNVNGLGAFKILRYGNQGLVAGDLIPSAYALLIFNAAGSKWELLNPQSTQTLSGTTASIGGSLLAAGTCTTAAATVSGAAIGRPVSVSASDGSLPSGAIMLSAAVTSSNTVTVQLCAVTDVIPAAKTYNVATR